MKQTIAKGLNGGEGEYIVVFGDNQNWINLTLRK